jgi:hypothetical protein
MKKNQILISRIKSSNLSAEEKKQLIEILNDENSNLDEFLKLLISILKIGSEFLKILDISP